MRGAPAAARALRRGLFPTLHGYHRRDLGADLLSALTLLAIALPEQLATARLAGMPPLTGLYAFVAGSAAFALLGTHRQLSVGADSTIAPLFAVGIAGIAEAGSPRSIELAGILAVCVGVIVAAVGLLRLGWIAEFLSTPIITGFLAGVAAIIVVHQLPDLLGIAAPGGGMLHRIAFVGRHLADLHPWSLGIGLGVLAAVVLAERVDRRLPAALVALVVSAALVAGLHLERHGVAVLGAVAATAPRLGLFGVAPGVLGRLLPLAGVVALVVVSQSAATIRAFPAPAEPGAEPSGGPGGERGEQVSRDFVGVGAGSILAGVLGSFPVDASPPRTAAVVATGGRSQLTSLAAAAAMVAIVPAAGLLRDVPAATLAAVLLFVASRIVHGRDLVAIARFSTFELALVLVGALTVALVGVEQGVAVAVALAILDRARRSARPTLHVLGQVPGTTSFAPLSSSEHAVEVPGVLVVLFATPLWYANAEHFRAEMADALHRSGGTARAVVLDALGMSDVDYTGAAALASVLDVLERRGIVLCLARAGARTRQSLRRAGVLRRIGEDRCFGTVGEAVAAVRVGGPPGGPSGGEGVPQPSAAGR